MSDTTTDTYRRFCQERTARQQALFDQEKPTITESLDGDPFLMVMASTQDPQITLTRELIMAGSSNWYGAWNAKQLAVFGIQWPPKKGWLRELVGKAIPKAQYDLFLSLKRELEHQKPS